MQLFDLILICWMQSLVLKKQLLALYYARFYGKFFLLIDLWLVHPRQKGIRLLVPLRLQTFLNRLFCVTFLSCLALTRFGHIL